MKPVTTTTVANSTNVTEVINKTTPTPENKTKKENKTPDNYKKHSESIVKSHLDKKATGNPLLALLIVLVCIPLRRFRK